MKYIDELFGKFAADMRTDVFIETKSNLQKSRSGPWRSAG
jgi:hypothetical protein